MTVTLIGRCKPQLRWIVPLVAGFAVVMIIFYARRFLNPMYPPYILVMSKDMGLSPKKCVHVQELLARSANGTISYDDWQFAKGLCDSNNNFQKAYSLMVIGSLYKTPYRAEAARRAEQCVSDSDPFVRANTLVSLARLHVSGWKELALQNLDNSDKQVRETSRNLLDREDKFK